MGAQNEPRTRKPDERTDDMNFIPEEIEAYARAHSDPPGPLLEALAKETRERMELYRMQVGPLEGAFLRLLVKLTSARRVLEVGMFTGYSALMMAEGLGDDGELITCEVDPEAEAIARRYFDRSPHGKKIQVRMGPALQTIAILKGPLDLVFIDADKENYASYFDAVLPLLRQGGLIVADNTLWSGRVLAPKEDSDRAMVAFNAKLAADERVERVQLTLRDGLTLIRKK
jgi:caffeoyl-CoA O-methyltransferase